MKKFLICFIVMVMSVWLLSCNHKIEQKGKSFIFFKQSYNMRFNPNSLSKIIGEVYPGIEYEVLDVYGDWINVTKLLKHLDYAIIADGRSMVSDTISGWIWQGFITNNKLKKTALLHELPDEKSKVLEVISTRDQYIVYDPYVTWVKIELDNHIIGWVYYDRKRSTIINI